jgi:DNA-3-methyladenine glycosylase
MRRLPRSFYNRDTAQVARELLGTYLVSSLDGTKRIGRIVEVEAYVGPQDLASHSSKGLTERNRVMFGPPGHAYVYMVYGMHFCLNVVTEREGHGSAVLLRALEPVRGIEGRTQGPALLCRTLGIDRRHNGSDLTRGNLCIASRPEEERPAIARSSRIGVQYAGSWARRRLRFYIRGSAYISGG